MSIKSLNEIITLDDRFKSSINLQLDLHKTHKAWGYIPTISSLNILNSYFMNVMNKKDNATILIGPYGKGKSHLLLVLLTILRLERNNGNEAIINKMIESFSSYDKEVAQNVKDIWQSKRMFLPVIISSTLGDLNQAFLLGLNEALTSAGLKNIIPETYYTEAIRVINNWETGYKDTYEKFQMKLKNEKQTVNSFITKLQLCDKTALEIFRRIFPELTSGSVFNPLVNAEVLKLYKDINDIICNDYNYNGMFIIFDEFSKFIESHDKTTVSNDMKIIQDICELAADSGENQIHITLVTHKSIKEYGNVLSNEVINAFTGIEGRIKENYFISSSKNNYELIKNAIKKDEQKLDELQREQNIFNKSYVDRYYNNVPCFKMMFLYNDFVDIVVKGCYPLSPISAYVLLNISEKVAQNERTLFTFISKDEPFSMANFILKHLGESEWTVEVDLIFDYFKSIFKKDITNVVVHNEWLKAEYALTGISDDKCRRLLKALALINIINKFDELPPNAEVLLLTASLGSESIEILELLEKKMLIYKKNSTGFYVFKSGVGADIKAKIRSERTLLGNNFDMCHYISLATDTEFILPKQYNQKYSMTRYFAVKYMIFADFLKLAKSEYLFSERFADGYIIKLVCREEDILKSVSLIESKLKELGDRRIIVLVPQRYFAYRQLVQDFVIIQKLKADNNFVEENKVLVNELELLEEDITFGIDSYIQNSFDSSNGNCVTVSFREDDVIAQEKTDLNRLVSYICESCYSLTTIINNEMINKRNITSPAIKKARKVIIDQILEGRIEESFYSGTSPEATIFRAVLKNTGVLSGTPELAMEYIINEINRFINGCEENKRNFEDLITILTDLPYGLRMGPVPIILSFVLVERNEDVIIYLRNKEQELNSDTIFNICDNPQEYFLYVEEGTNEKREYLEALMKLFGLSAINKSSNMNATQLTIEIQRWFKSLPQITRSFKNEKEIVTSNFDMNLVIKFKSLLQKVDINPYEMIYKDIPAVFGSMNYTDILAQIVVIKQLLESYYYDYIDDLIVATKKIFSGSSKDSLASTLTAWHEDQSLTAKQGLYEEHISELLNYVGRTGTYDDTVIMKKIAKIISGLYIENWNEDIKEKFLDDLKAIRYQVENIVDKNIPDQGKFKLSFVDSNSQEVVKYYMGISENTGYYLRNLISEAIDEFGDTISLNDKVAVLVEMLEKVLK
nr:hypothetical protein [uncultured Lachnoclostridium sp.]